jgi:hypothetical protein
MPDAQHIREVDKVATYTTIAEGSKWEDAVEIGGVPAWQKFLIFFIYWNACGLIIFGIYYYYKRVFLEPHLRGDHQPSQKTVQSDDDSDGYGDDSSEEDSSGTLLITFLHPIVSLDPHCVHHFLFR